MNWRLDWSTGVTLKKRLLGGYLFNFPKAPGHVNMLTSDVADAVRLVAVTFQIKGVDPVFNALGGTDGGHALPRIRLYVQRKGDNMSGRGQYEFYRWWSSAFYNLEVTSGKVILVASADPVAWTSVLGKDGRSHVPEFRAAFADPDRVGITFGGMFAGHGVNLLFGSAKFIVYDLKIRA